MSPDSTWMHDCLETHWWLVKCDWHMPCSAMAYVIWAYKKFPECSPTHKKAGLCAVMPMWLVHIKEHVWTIGTCPTTILLSAMSECVNECCIERPKWKRGIASWDGRPVCSSGSWSGRGWLPSRKVEWHIMKKVAWGGKWKIVKQHLKI